ncbi:MAG: response regulator [Actinomycetota bacterium]|nr:response regulator [Actinomycetota bacterium]
MVTSLLIVEDNELLRKTVAAHLRDGGRFDSVIEAGTGAEALSAAAEREFVAVVLDLSLPDVRGSSIISALRAHSPAAHIVVFSADINGGAEAARFGADGFVLKGVDLAELDRHFVA